MERIEAKKMESERAEAKQKEADRKKVERKEAEIREKESAAWQRIEAEGKNTEEKEAKKQNETICVSLVAYEEEEYMKALIQNFLHFTEPSTKLAIHLDRHSSYNGSEPRSWASNRIAITRTRVGVNRLEGSVLYAHMLNVKTMEDTWPGACKYWVMQASNMVWVRSGMEPHVRDYKYSPLGKHSKPMRCAFDPVDHSQTFVTFSDMIISKKIKKIYGWGQPEGSFFPFSMVKQFERKMTRHSQDMDDNGSGIFRAKCPLESTWLQTYALNWESVPEGLEFEERRKAMTPLCRNLISDGEKENGDSRKMSEVSKVMRGQEALEAHETSYKYNFAVKLSQPVTKFIVDLSKGTS